MPFEITNDITTHIGSTCTPLSLRWYRSLLEARLCYIARSETSPIKTIELKESREGEQIGSQY